MRYTPRSVIAVRDYFQANLNTRKNVLAAVDGLTIPDITQFFVGEWWVNPAPYYLFVFADDIQPETKVSGQLNGVYNDNITLGIRYKLSADLSECLNVYTLGSAIIDLLDPRSPNIGDPTLGGRVSACIIENIDYGAIGEVNDGTPTSYGLVVSLTVRNSEGAPTP